MSASAQVSVYPLRQPHLGPAVDVVRDVLVAHGLAPQVGEVVMTFSVSNACPVPNPPA